MPSIILLGTLDTKLDEFRFLYDQLTTPPFTTTTPIKVTLIDCGREHVQDNRITIDHTHLLSQYGDHETKPISDLPRGEVIKYMIECTARCVKSLIAHGDVHGIIGAGGSGGTSLVSAVMRNAAPIGMPKLIASTVASGDTGPLVEETDITMMYSVVDIAGSNELLRNILSNAAAAMVGMAANYERLQQELPRDRKVRIGVTMFGVTTPGVNRIRKHLESKYDAEVFIFHATGHGGRAMERLVDEGRLDAVIDLTTTEICDYLMGGNMSAGPNRLEASLKAGIPTILSLGATDMVNFGPRTSVPVKYEGRKLFEHNPAVTLMRTTSGECKQVAEFMVDKIKQYAKDQRKVQVWIPRGGVSMIAIPGGPFADEAADRVLFETLRQELKSTSVRLVEDSRDVNDSSFATDVADSIMSMLEGTN